MTNRPPPATLARPGWRSKAEGVPIKLAWFIFATLLAMCAVISAAFIAGEQPSTESEPDESGAVTRTYQGHGIAHGEYETMLAGGPGAERHSNVLWIGWALALALATLFVSLLLFGMRKKGRHGPAVVPVLVCGAIYVGIFTMLFFSYRAYMNEPSPELVLALPKPTAWMIYGIWVFPVSFVFIYRHFFGTWYLTDDDMDRFKALLAEQEQSGEDRA